MSGIQFNIFNINNVQNSRSHVITVKFLDTPDVVVNTYITDVWHLIRLVETVIQDNGAGDRKFSRYQFNYSGISEDNPIVIEAREYLISKLIIKKPEIPSQSTSSQSSQSSPSTPLSNAINACDLEQEMIRNLPLTSSLPKNSDFPQYNQTPKPAKTMPC